MIVMKIYKTCRLVFGFEQEVSYFADKNKAIQEFNNILSKEQKNTIVFPDEEEFNKEVFSLNEDSDGWNLVRATHPIIIREKEGNLQGYIPPVFGDTFVMLEEIKVIQ